MLADYRLSIVAIQAWPFSYTRFGNNPVRGHILSTEQKYTENGREIIAICRYNKYKKSYPNIVLVIVDPKIMKYSTKLGTMYV